MDVSWDYVDSVLREFLDGNSILLHGKVTFD